MNILLRDTCTKFSCAIDASENTLLRMLEDDKRPKVAVERGAWIERMDKLVHCLNERVQLVAATAKFLA